MPDGRLPHSLRGYFLSRGDASRRVLLTVSRDRDGGSYSNRRVIAVQEGRVILNMAASFHRPEDGPVYHAHAAPDVEPPDELHDSDRRTPMHGVRASRSRASSGPRGSGSGPGTNSTATRCTPAR